MKTKKWLFSLFTIMLIVALAVGLTSCGEDDNTKPTVTLQSIGIEGKGTCYFEDFDLSNYKVVATYSDNNVKRIPLTANMLSEDSRNNLTYLGDGKKVLSATYGGKSATFNLQMSSNEELPAIEGVTIYGADYIYDGTAKSLSVDGEGVYVNYRVVVLNENSEETDIVYYNTNSQINAGNYRVKATIQKAGYRVKEIDADLSIAKKQIARPDTPKALTFNDQPQKITDILKSPDYIVKGETYGKDAGTYNVIISLSNPNYVWATDDTHDELSTEAFALQWTINKRAIDLSRVKWDDKKEYLYNGRTQTIKLMNVPSRQVSVVYKNNSAIEADDYIAEAKFTVKYPNNEYITGSDTMTTEWKIYHNRLNTDPNDPNSLKFDDKTVTYTGKAQYVEVKNANGMTVVYDNNGQIDVGTYRVKATITKEGYEPEYMEAMLTISRIEINVPTIQNPTNVYNGRVQDVDFGLHDLSGIEIIGCHSAIEPNTFRLRYALRDKHNTMWVGSNEDEGIILTGDISNGDMINGTVVSTEWCISKVVLPTIDLSWDYEGAINYVYDGTLKSVRLLTDEIRGIKVVHYNNEYTDAGSYKATASIELLYDEKYYENVGEFTTKYELEWQISKQRIDDTIFWNYQDAFIFHEDPDNFDYEVELVGIPDGKDIVKYVGTKRASAVGAYTVEAVINNNYELINEGNVDLRLEWQIIENPIDEDMYNKFEIVGTVKTYNGAMQSFDYINLPIGSNIIIKEGARSYKDAGEYPITIYITKKGYTAIVKNFTFIIEPKKVELPALNEETVLEYNGKVQTCDLIYDGKLCNVSGNTGMKAKDFTAVVSLKDDKNYVWQDDTNTPKEIPWKIEKLRFNSADLMWDYGQSFTYSGKEYAPILKGLQDGIKVVYTYYIKTEDGEFVPTNTIDVGVYFARARFALEDMDRSNYFNPDRIEGYAISDLEWEIKPLVVDIDGVVWNWDKENPLLYNGKEQEIILKNLPDEIKDLIVYSGNKAKEGGIDYIATATFLGGKNYNLLNSKFDANGEWKITWWIVRNELDWFKANSSSTFTYDGNNHYPTLDIKGKTYIYKAIADGDKTRYAFVSDSGEELTGSGNAFVYQENKYDSQLNITFECDDTLIDAGKKVITITASKDMYEVKVITVELEITPQKIDLPNVQSAEGYSFVYDGNEHRINVDIDDELYSVTHNYATSAGKYRLNISLKDTNHAWKGGTVADNVAVKDGSQDDIIIGWEIKPKKVVKPRFENNRIEVTYDGQEHSLVIIDSIDKDCYVVKGNRRITADIEKDYEVSISLINHNYIWEDDTTGDIIGHIKINPMLIEKPTIPDKLEYDFTGNEITIPIDKNDAYEIIGKLSATERGEYTVVIRFTNKRNYRWSDGDTSDSITFVWVIK